MFLCSQRGESILKCLAPGTTQVKRGIFHKALLRHRTVILKCYYTHIGHRAYYTSNFCILNMLVYFYESCESTFHFSIYPLSSVLIFDFFFGVLKHRMITVRIRIALAQKQSELYLIAII